MESGKHGIPSTRIMLRKSGELTSSRYLLYRLEFCMFWSSFIMGQGESFILQSLIRQINSGSRNSSALRLHMTEHQNTSSTTMIPFSSLEISRSFLTIPVLRQSQPEERLPGRTHMLNGLSALLGANFSTM